MTPGPEAALDQLAVAAESAERSLDAVSLSIALLDRAGVLATSGRHGEAVADALAAADRLRDRGHPDPHALMCIGVAANVLLQTGETDDARALVVDLVDEARSPVTLTIGHLLSGMLDLDASELGPAREHLEMARFLAAPLLDGRIAGNLALGRAELALTEGRPDDARAAVDEGVDLVERTGDDDVLCELCLFGLRIAADLAAHADLRRSERAKAREAAAVSRYERHLAPRAAGAVAVAWQAERHRLAGASDPQAWAEAAERWHDVGRPRHAVLARIRCAEALLARAQADARADAPAALERAVKEAEVIGSRLLADQARAVARRAGIDVLARGRGRERDRRSMARPADPRSHLAALTRREREVLDLLVYGSTNRQIGAQLYISTKTASVHVSRILSKLGAVTRSEAAALARRA